MNPKPSTEKPAKTVPRTRSPLVQNWLQARIAQPELFDEPGQGGQPVAVGWAKAFEAWAGAMDQDGTLRSAASVRAYRQLWATLACWAIDEQSPAIPVDRLSADDLRLYIDSRAGRSDESHRVSARHAWRLLTFVDRVLVHRAGELGLPAANRCAHELLQSNRQWRWAHSVEQDPSLAHLSAQDARRLVEFLAASLPRSGRRGLLRSWG